MGKNYDSIQGRKNEIKKYIYIGKQQFERLQISHWKTKIDEKLKKIYFILIS